MNATPHAEDDAAPELAAYALGALDPADRAAVEALLANAPQHQAELGRLREVVALLPYATPAATPPAHVRTQLMARIAADQAEERPGVAPPQPRPWARMRVALGVGLATLVLALGGIGLSLNQRLAALDQTNQTLVATISALQGSLATTQADQAELVNQLSEVSAQLTRSEERISQLGQELARDGYVISFVSAPGVATRQLNPSSPVLPARGEMYMYPGETSAVVLFSGLPDLAPGQVYQFWLADGTQQTGAGTFVVDENGIARLLVEAPREVNAFREIMVTIEPAGGSETPSDTVVLAGSL